MSQWYIKQVRDCLHAWSDELICKKCGVTYISWMGSGPLSKKAKEQAEREYYLKKGVELTDGGGI